MVEVHQDFSIHLSLEEIPSVSSIFPLVSFYPFHPIPLLHSNLELLSFELDEYYEEEETSEGGRKEGGRGWGSRRKGRGQIGTACRLTRQERRAGLGLEGGERGGEGRREEKGRSQEGRGGGEITLMEEREEMER